MVGILLSKIPQSSGHYQQKGKSAADNLSKARQEQNVHCLSLQYIIIQNNSGLSFNPKLEVYIYNLC